MMADFVYDGSRIVFTFTPENGDSLRPRSFSETTQVMFRHTISSTFPQVHPDRLAFVAILLTLPFAEERLKLNWSVSQKFLEAFHVISRIRIEAETGYVEPIEMSETGLPGLSFSGGADSTAALAVMPEDTVPLFMLRTKRKTISLYCSDAAEKSCTLLQNLGYSTQVIESDLEYIREPLGFPVDLAVGAPVVLLAEHLNIRSIAFGTIMESAYGTGGKKFREYGDSPHYKLWATLFDAIGISYSLPVAGVSEVGTSIILQETPYGRFSQSCIRGTWQNPCLNCWKCFRKELLSLGLNKGSTDMIIEKMLTESKEVRIKLLEDRPIKHECVLTYALSNISNSTAPFQKLYSLVRGGVLDCTWMEKWYSHSEEFIDAAYRDYTKSRLREILGEMNSDQIIKFKSWENECDADREERLNEFSSTLNEFISSQ